MLFVIGEAKAVAGDWIELADSVRCLLRAPIGALWAKALYCLFSIGVDCVLIAFIGTIPVTRDNPGVVDLSI